MHRAALFADFDMLPRNFAIDNAKSQIDFEAKHDADFAYEVFGLARFRVNAFVDRNGVGAVLRQIPIDIVPADELGPAHGTSSTGGANLDHLCLRVEPFDAAAIAKHFAAHGVECGEEKSRYGAEGQGPSVYLTDPEGNGVELKGPVARS